MSWISKAAFVVLWLVIAVEYEVNARDLRVGAFNIQVYGRSKAQKPEVMAVLVKVIC